MIFRTLIAMAVCTLGIARAAEPPLPADVARWHAAGFTGQQITVAVLDSGFRGYRVHLPASVEAKSFRTDGNLEPNDSMHGLICADATRRLAPGCDLILANWEPDDPRSFIAAVRWCRQHGARIVSCSLVMPGWSDGRGGGPIHRELREALGDALLFASAGNLAERHWTGPFHGRREHRWQDAATANEVYPWGTQAVSIELTASSDVRYLLHVRDQFGRDVAEDVPLPHAGPGSRAVRFIPDRTRQYVTSVELIAGTPGEIRLIALGADLEYSTPRLGCMVFPGDGEKIIAVGAVDERGRRADFSARGHAGESIKPDLVARVPLFTALRETPFRGTSAATPQAAAMAALLWSRDRQLTSREIRARLYDCCVDVGEPGPDADTGRGLPGLR